MKLISTLFVLTITSMLFSQNTVSGIVYDTKGKPIEGANVYIEGTYDGNTSNENGAFSFTTEAINVLILIVSYITFETYTKTGSISDFKGLKITLREDVNALDAVVISAGSFAAGDNSKINALYAKAKSIAPNNPRVLLNKAQWDIGSAKFFGQETAPFCKDIQKSLELFATFKAETPFHPNWGKEQATKALNECGK